MKLKITSWRGHHERHQLALAVKFAVAKAIAETAGSVFVILDDSFACFDGARVRAAEAFLEEAVADDRVQIIFMTCHLEWARAWAARAGPELHYIDLETAAQYYRTPPALL